MTEKKQIYKCAACGLVVEVLTGAKGSPVCCGAPMELLEAKTADSAKEKHVPVITSSGCCTEVKVGSVPHPMAEDHFIEWIEVEADGKTCRQYLQPGQEPAAAFKCIGEGTVAREFCNKHGLWASE